MPANFMTSSTNSSAEFARQGFPQVSVRDRWERYRILPAGG
jgi:hypothetical protein